MAQALVGVGPRGVDVGAVGQHELEGVEGVVAVLDDAAAHAGGVVADHPADHGGVDRGGIGADAGAVGSEHAVQVRAHDRGLRPDPPPAVQHARRLPVRRELDQQVVADRLAGERGAGGAEGEMAAVARAQ